MQQPASEPKPPRSLAILGDALTAIVPPADPFDPNGTWDHGYRVHTVVPSASGQQVAVQPQGSLYLQRRPVDDATFELHVRQATMNAINTKYLVEARVVCMADRLAQPKEWELSSRIIGAQGEPKAETEYSETAVVRDGMIHRQGARQRSMPASDPFTSNWSLFDALQRLPQEHAGTLEFDMLEELDLLKPGQRLVRRGAVEVELSGRAVRLRGLDQTGRGILPYGYWLDDTGRLLIAVGGMRAYLWDASVVNEAAS